MAKNLYGILTDLSGTIHIGDKLTSNCAQAIEKLKNLKVPYRYVTNTTKESKQSLVNRLQRLGLEIDHMEVYTSLTSAKHYVLSKNLAPHLILSDDALKDFEDISKTDHDPNAVLVGLAPEKFDYGSMNIAFQYLTKGAELIAVHKGRYYKREDGLALGPGAFVAGLEYATNSKAIIIGKPEKEFFMGALHGMNCAEDATIFMIGDDVIDDIDGGQRAGFKGILVKTGKYQPGDESLIHPPPHKVVDCFSQAIDYVESTLNK